MSGTKELLFNGLTGVKAFEFGMNGLILSPKFSYFEATK